MVVVLAALAFTTRSYRTLSREYTEAPAGDGDTDGDGDGEPAIGPASAAQARAGDAGLG